MPSKPWTTSAEAEFLQSYLERYKNTQKTQTYYQFWGNVFEAWEHTFPERNKLFSGQEYLTTQQEETLGKALRSRRQQISTWFRWRTSTKSRTTIKKRTNEFTRILGETSRSLQPAEMYSKLHYKDKIQPLVRARIKEQQLTTNGAILNVVKLVTQEMFDSEGAEMKSLVTEKLAEHVAEKARVAEQARTPEQYLSSIQDCPSILGRFLDLLAHRTGWAFTVLMGGPDPGSNGEIAVASYHVGENQLGNQFGQAHPNFEEAFVEPYTQFLLGVFPPEIRQTRCIDSDQTSSGLLSPPCSDASIPFAGGESSSFYSSPSSSPCSNASLLLSSEPTGPPTSLVNSNNNNIFPPIPPVPASSLVSNASPLAPTAFPVSDASLNSLGLFTLPSNFLSGSTFLNDCGRTSAAPLPTEVLTDDYSCRTGGTSSIPSTEFSVGQNNSPTNDSFMQLLASSPNDGLNSLNFEEMAQFLQSFDFTAPHPDFTPSQNKSSPYTGPAASLPIPPIRNNPSLAAATPCPALPPAPAEQPSVHPPPPVLPADSTSPLQPPSPTTPPTESPFSRPDLGTSRRSNRPIVPSLRAQKMNAISENSVRPAGKEITSSNAPSITPSWVDSAVAHLRMRDLGTEWDKCVTTWLEVEKMLLYKSKGSLPNVQLCPEEWSKWTAKSRNGVRSYDLTPVIESVKGFGMAIMHWWREIQPAFRQGKGNLPLPIYTTPDSTADIWAPLRKGGPNGLISLLTLLVWWGQVANLPSRWEVNQQENWDNVVLDVRQVLECILRAGGKRIGDKHDDSSCAKRRRISELI